MQEIWKDIIGYEGLYQVSNLGRVKSLGGKRGSSSKSYTSKERILKQHICKGYYKLTLYNGGKPRQFRVNQLVAIAFLPNPDNLPIVNHKDENPLNNNVDNLEWCTVKYNINYGNAKDKIRNSHIGLKASDETRKKMSESHKGDRNGMYGKQHSEETKQIISQHTKRLWEEGVFNNGKK